MNVRTKKLLARISSLILLVGSIFFGLLTILSKLYMFDHITASAVSMPYGVDAITAYQLLLTLVIFLIGMGLASYKPSDKKKYRQNVVHMPKAKHHEICVYRTADGDISKLIPIDKKNVS